MQIIPLSAVPSQSLSVLLAGQNCQINVYEKTTGVYLDLFISNAPILTTVICRNRVEMMTQEYRGFVGGLVFVDTQGSNDPMSTGLGARYLLLYLAENESI